MPKQVTTKRKAKGSHHTPKVMPTKKLKKASRQPALNSQLHSASAPDSSLSESPPPPSLTSGSSIEDLSSLTSGSSIEDLSSSTSMLQEKQPNHGGAQETEDISWGELCAMSYEELQEYGRSLGLSDRAWEHPSL